LFKNSQPFVKKCPKTAGGGIFLTHTAYRAQVSGENQVA